MFAQKFPVWIRETKRVKITLLRFSILTASDLSRKDDFEQLFNFEGPVVSECTPLAKTTGKRLCVIDEITRVNTPRENLMITKHKSVWRAKGTTYWFVLCGIFFFCRQFLVGSTSLIPSLRGRWKRTVRNQPFLLWLVAYCTFWTPPSSFDLKKHGAAVHSSTSDTKNFVDHEI